MANNDQAHDVATYASSVRAALSDLPPDQAEVLLEDLEDHLREVASEAGGPLAERLGPPEQYAQELRAAYGTVHAGGTRQDPALRDLKMAVRRVTASAWFAQVRAFLPELRPAWWVLRAYIVVLLLTEAFSPNYNLRPIPNPFSSRGLLEIVAAAIAIVLSIRLGRRSRPLAKSGRLLAIGANVMIALIAIPVLARMGTFPSYAMVESGVAGQSQPLIMPNGDALTNIYPYSRDGKPLTDVLLYDQEGRPLTTSPNVGDVTTESPVGADGQPITNAYPLRQRHLNGDPVSAPRVALPPWPAASPTASPTLSPSPSPTH
jgi:HAAS domain-containing protein